MIDSFRATRRVRLKPENITFVYKETPSYSQGRKAPAGHKFGNGLT